MATLNSASSSGTVPSPGHNVRSPPPETSSSSTSDPVTKDPPDAPSTSESIRSSEPGGERLESGSDLDPPKEIGEPQEEPGCGHIPPKDLGVAKEEEEILPLDLSSHLFFAAGGQAYLLANLPLPRGSELSLPKGFPWDEASAKEEPSLPLLTHFPSSHLTTLHIQHGFDPIQGFSSSDQMLSHDTSAPSLAARPSPEVPDTSTVTPSCRLADDYTPAPAAFQGLSLSSHMSLLHSRNSCKTLKCPKCNWHYKYQQTLDVHMREKHPESNSHCSYCSAGGAHPRLARGESYNCGYKPYRCDVCNYSTTTKGNLSIHMQSDKHLANLQGFQAGPGGQASPPEASLPPTSVGDKEPKTKSSWQCKVCSYETSISRNLRIHMTSALQHL